MTEGEATAAGRRPAHHRAPDSHLGFLLWRASRVFLDALRQELADRGYDDLSPSHVNVMPMLDADGTNAQVLAGRIGVTKQAAGRIIGELDRAGYVRRVTDLGDGRARLVLFTEKGRALLEEGEQAKLALEERWLAGLDVETVTLLKRALGTIVERETSRGRAGRPDATRASG